MLKFKKKQQFASITASVFPLAAESSINWGTFFFVFDSELRHSQHRQLVAMKPTELLKRPSEFSLSDASSKISEASNASKTPRI